MMGCTTIPSRAKYLPEVIKQVAKQTHKPDVFCIGIPRFSTREKMPYDIASILDMTKRYSRDMDGFDVMISLLDEDYGPLCKLAGMLAVAPENTIMITIDDDHVYDKTLVETLLHGTKDFPDACVCLCGHSLGRVAKGVHAWGYRQTGFDSVPILNTLQLKHGSPVDIISGWAGVLYKRNMFGPGRGLYLSPDLEFYRRTDGIHRLHQNDDLYISAWLSSYGIQRVVIKYPGAYEQRQVAEIGGTNPLCQAGHKNWLKGHVVHFAHWWKLIGDLESRGYFAETAAVPPTKSILCMGTSLAIVALLGSAFACSMIVRLKKK